MSFQTTLMKMTSAGGYEWASYSEESNALDSGSFTTTGLLEQVNMTRDSTDYLWYST